MPSLLPTTQEGIVALLDSLEVTLLNLENGSPQAVITGLRLLVRTAQLLAPFANQPEVAALQREIQQILAYSEFSQPQPIREILVETKKVLEQLAVRMSGVQVRLLLVEPDDGLADLLTAMLQTPYRQIHRVATAAEAQQWLQQQRSAHLIITELFLPDLDGRSLILWIRQQPQTQQMPILVLSAHLSSAVKAECYALGADDVLEKPFDPAELSLIVASLLQRMILQQGSDPLTGLPGRALLEETFARLQQLHRQTGAPFLVAFVDLDRFAEINERYGTAIADAILRQVAWHFGRLLRPGDVVGRWEADTFCLLLPDTSETQARLLLERILEALQTEPIKLAEAPPLTLSFSACIFPLSGNKPARLMDLHQQSQQCLQRRRADAPVQSIHEYLAHKRRILLVEDDPDIAALIQIRLQRDGYEVVHLANGREAAEWARQHTADLVILDVKLPGMDGFELLAFLRAQPAFAEVPIVMLTSLSQEQHVVRGFELGADDHVVKPFSPVELSARVRRLLHRQTPQLVTL